MKVTKLCAEVRFKFQPFFFFNRSVRHLYTDRYQFELANRLPTQDTDNSDDDDQPPT